LVAIVGDQDDVTVGARLGTHILRVDRPASVVFSVRSLSLLGSFDVDRQANYKRDRLTDARRRAVFEWLTSQGMTTDAAESWCDAWEADATARGLHRRGLDYWKEAGPWIAERLKTGQPPT